MKKAKALVLFSGGLDSILVVRILQEQGITVKGIHFTCPFYSSGWARRSAKVMGIPLIEVAVDDRYFKLVKDPPHGRGSEMNHCIDCKIFFIKEAEKIRKEEGFDFLATGEVVGERPMSQTKPSLREIEDSAGLSRRIVRPLSAKVLPRTEAEKEGLIDRESMYGITGRSRKPQMELARKLGVKDYPSPAGGCLLTDPEYAKRLREHMKKEGKVSWEQGELLKLGRHFRYKGVKIVVGRNLEDNKSIEAVARKMGLPELEVVDIPGPLTVIAKKRPAKDVIAKAAALTVRYSKESIGAPVEVRIGEKKEIVEAKAADNAECERLMV